MSNVLEQLESRILQAVSQIADAKEEGVQQLLSRQVSVEPTDSLWSLFNAIQHVAVVDGDGNGDGNGEENGDGTVVPEEFKLVIDTRQKDTGLSGTSTLFIIPTGNTGAYDWSIDWGDSQTEKASGTGSNSSVGVSHTYATAGQYTITITPNGSIDAWFAAYGFGTSSIIGTAHEGANRQKVVSCLSQITPLMVGTEEQVTSGTLGNNVCQRWFDRCTGKGFNLGNEFGFSQEWKGITTVGNNFCSIMFSDCHSLTALSANLSLPQNITTVGDYFCYQMFYNCSFLTALSANFNLPQKITTVGTYFCDNMFKGCAALATLSDNFNLPQSLTTVMNYFCSDMFNGCTLLGVLPNSFNLPQNLITVGTNFCWQMFYLCTNDDFKVPAGFKFPQGLLQTEVDKGGVFTYMFHVTTNKTWQLAGDAAAIVGSLPVPVSSRLTFRTGSYAGNSDTYGPSRWGAGFTGLHANWK